MTPEFENVTMDQLALMTYRGFNDLEERLGKKIDGVEERLDKKIDGVELRLTEQLDRIENVLIRDDRKRIERIEDKLLKVEVILGKRL